MKFKNKRIKKRRENEKLHAEYRRIVRYCRHPKWRAKLRNFIRKTRYHKMEVLRRNTGGYYCLSDIWDAKDFRGCVGI